ncbi:hypothetical protein [Paenibacillus sp. O199]|uniref:hypothetical protein n=1 Tax=Paenibacillus sp. O199 TaxID=1643925 RepID=UPI0007BF6BC3|nr:hypothetical protein [Paenibacillus sp. O199]
MEREMVFDQKFSIVTKDGNEETFNFFMFEDTPIITYKKWEHSFYTNFEAQGWTSKDRPDFANKGLVFIISVNNTMLDWCALYHELGHVKNKHPLGLKGRLEKVTEGIVSPYELEADQYVLKNMGREKTTVWLESLIMYLTDEINKREIYKESGYLQEAGLKGLEMYYVSLKEVQLRMNYL